MPKTIIESFPKEKRKAREDGSYILNIAECFADTVQGENFTGIPCTFLRFQHCTLSCQWCFHPNTNITTSEGPRHIKDICVGDVLYTLDPLKGVVQTEVKNVLTHKSPVSDMMQIKFKGGEDQLITCTKSHKFYVKDRGWVGAQDIKVGEVILTLDASMRMKHFNPMRTPSTVMKMSKTLRKGYSEGQIRPYIRTDELRALQSTLKMGDKNPMKNPEVVKKSAMNRFGHPSKLEERYMKKFTNLSMNITYTGNNQLCIGDNIHGYRFPDFVIDGTNKLIEIYDTTFKYGTKEKGFRDSKWETRVSEHYKLFGYDVLFLTEKDLKLNKFDKLFNYVFNGSVVEKVITTLSSKQKAALFGSSSVQTCDVYNLSCAPYNTFLVQGHLVHNCDTIEVWRFGNPYSVNELLDMWENASAIEGFRNGQHLVFTGGSPVRQQKGIIELTKAFIERYGFKPFYEIENECTLMPSEDLKLVIDRWNNSPKLSTSGNMDHARYKPDILEVLSALPDSWFKFVICEESDWDEIVKDFITPGLIKKEQLVLMPEGATREELQQHYQMVVDMAVKYGVRMTDRLHVTIWNRKTGV